MQGLALGLNAGLGNAGVSIMQFLIPWAITFGMFGKFGGDPQEFLAGGEPQQLWIQNATLIWVPIMTVLAIMAWLLMNNLPQHRCGPAPGGHRQISLAADDRLSRHRGGRRLPGLHSATGSRSYCESSSFFSLR